VLLLTTASAVVCMQDNVKKENPESKQDLEEKKFCSVCQCEIDQKSDYTTLRCDHRFHNKECIYKWIHEKKDKSTKEQTCPICRGLAGKFLSNSLLCILCKGNTIDLIDIQNKIDTQNKIFKKIKTIKLQNKKNVGKINLKGNPKIIQELLKKYLS